MKHRVRQTGRIKTGKNPEQFTRTRNGEDIEPSAEYILIKLQMQLLLLGSIQKGLSTCWRNTSQPQICS
jgi:hypothetical protein